MPDFIIRNTYAVNNGQSMTCENNSQQQIFHSLYINIDSEILFLKMSAICHLSVYLSAAQNL